MEHILRDEKEWFGVRNSQSLPSNTLNNIAPNIPFIGYNNLKSEIIKHDKIIIHGISGVGKNMLARYYCEHFNELKIYKVDPSKLSKYVGQTEEYLHQLFSSNGIIVVDHMETLLPNRNENQSNILNRIIMQFLVHLDGISTYDCKFIGITSNLDGIDAAIKRPGRMDYLMKMEHQDESLIWNHYCKRYKIEVVKPSLSFDSAAHIHHYIYNRCLSQITKR